MTRPRIQTRLSYLFFAIAILAIVFAVFVSNAGTVKVRCKVVYYGAVEKVGIRSGPVQIDVDQDTHCAFVRTDDFAVRTDFPLQIGLTEQECKSLIEQFPINSQFEIRYRPNPRFGLPAQDAHTTVVRYLRNYVSSIKIRPDEL